MQEICIRYIISGVVQGVYFRSFSVDQASKIGVKGYARNLSTGEVEIVACGTKHLLAEFENALEVGPSTAKVNSIDKKTMEYKNYDNFISVATK